jgi:hypothetical protein
LESVAAYLSDVRFTPRADIDTTQMNARFGSKADIRAAKSHVRFAPKSGHSVVIEECPLRANSGHRHTLFDNFVGANKESARNGQTESVGRFDVDHQFELWLKIKNPKAPAATRAIDGTF